MTWLSVVPAWGWWLLAVLLVGGGQQLRIIGLEGELAAERAVSTDQLGKLAACRETRDNLLAQVSEQSDAVADLRAKADAKAQQAGLAQAGARVQAQVEYQVANRLQQERTGGDACAAATSVIDQELGL